MMKEFWR